MDHQIVPQLKSTVQRTDLKGRIYLRTSARTIEFDLGGVHQYVVEALDGKRNVATIIDSLRTTNPRFTSEEVNNALDDLDREYLLDDQCTLTPDSVDERWTRNVNFLGSFCDVTQSKYDAQLKLSEAKVTLLGLGGLGSHILYGLASLGVKDIQAIEFDSVEMSNLNRQILYTPKDIGRQKAEAAAERIREYQPDLKFSVVNRKIEGPDDVYEVAAGRDIIICVADRPKMEILYWVNEACVRADIPLITGGLDTQVARYYSMVPSKGCLECWRSSVRKDGGLSDDLLDEQSRSQLRGDNAAFAPFVSMIAGLMLAEFVKLATGLGGEPTAIGRVREIDFATLSLSTVETWKGSSSCPCCSATA